ncbi:MAG: nitronate monooxygenase [Clostridiales Family XIII bacterium]|jgi:NAD(P)H-dependent flavin oxidoreductase YrpB (nitropropane dioxygenase family)/DNA-binding MarR family transcriptional regulator|nr:nitronate monooxygenase [Clostridiales Family XIII bacterium]
MKTQFDKPGKIFARLFQTIPPILDDAARRASGGRISGSEMHVLTEIGLGKAKTMTQVAAGLRISVGALTTAIDKLVRKGCVDRFRVPEDRRIVKLALTETGAAFARAHTEFRERMTKAAFASLAEEQRSLLLLALENVEEYFRMQAVRPIREEREPPLRAVRIGALDIPVPIVQGDMGAAFSSPRLAAAIATCGGVGVITAAQPGFAESDYEKDPQTANLRAFRRDVADACARILKKKGPVGAIAVSVLYAAPDCAHTVRAAIEAGARIVIAGMGIPVSLPAMAGDSGVMLVPMLSSARAVRLLRKSWAKKYNRAPDAVIFEGPSKCGILGFKEEQLDSATAGFYRSVVEIKRELADLPNCPLIVANGEMSRADVKRAVAYGADGIQLDTSFVLTSECDAPQSVRAVYAQAQRRETLILKSPLGRPVRMLRNALADRVARGNTEPAHCIDCIDLCPKKDIPFCLAEVLGATARGDAENGILFCAENGGRAAPHAAVADIFRAFC